MLKLHLEFEKKRDFESDVEFPDGKMKILRIWAQFVANPEICQERELLVPIKPALKVLAVCHFHLFILDYFSQSEVDQWNLCCYSAFCINSAK